MQKQIIVLLCLVASTSAMPTKGGFDVLRTPAPAAAVYRSVKGGYVQAPHYVQAPVKGLSHPVSYQQSYQAPIESQTLQAPVAQPTIQAPVKGSSSEQWTQSQQVAEPAPALQAPVVEQAPAVQTPVAEQAPAPALYSGVKGGFVQAPHFVQAPVKGLSRPVYQQSYQAPIESQTLQAPVAQPTIQAPVKGGASEQLASAPIKGAASEQLASAPIVEQAPALQAPAVEQAPALQAPVEQAPAVQAPVTEQAPAVHSAVKGDFVQAPQFTQSAKGGALEQPASQAPVAEQAPLAPVKGAISAPLAAPAQTFEQAPAVQAPAKGTAELSTAQAPLLEQAPAQSTM